MVYPALLPTIKADAHTSAASSRLNWCPRRFKWTRPFRQKTKSGFCACAITFQLASNTERLKEQTSGDKIAWCFACEMQAHLSTRDPGFPSHISRITEVVTAELQKVELELSPCCIYPVLKKQQLVLTPVYQMSPSYFPLAKCTSCPGSKTVIRTPSVVWFLYRSSVTKIFQVTHQQHYRTKGRNVEEQERVRELTL